MSPLTDTRFPVIALAGPPKARGYQHGRRFRTEIRALLEDLRRTTDPALWRSAATQIAAAMPLIAEHAPRIAEEIAGLALGSECAEADLLAHIGFEFLAGPSSGCSAMAVAGSGEGAIVAQNWDAPPGEHKRLGLFLHVEGEERRTAILGPVGGLAWVGLNSHGLGLVNNDLLLRDRAPGLPSQIIRRLILETEQVADAEAKLHRLPHMAGRSYVLGDAAGHVAGVEVSATSGIRTLADASIVRHTNHALSDLAEKEDVEALSSVYPSSRERLEMLKATPPPSNVEQVKAVLRSEANGADSVCKRASVREPTETAFSIIMETRARRLHLAMGRPTVQPYSVLVL